MAEGKPGLSVKGNLSRPTKIKLSRATVESVLLYGCETWTMTSALNYVIDGFYTRLLRKVLGISWRSRTTPHLCHLCMFALSARSPAVSRPPDWLDSSRI